VLLGLLYRSEIGALQAVVYCTENPPTTASRNSCRFTSMRRFVLAALLVLIAAPPARSSSGRRFCRLRRRSQATAAAWQTPMASQSMAAARSSAFGPSAHVRNLAAMCARRHFGNGQRELCTIATYASCGNVNLPPSSIAGVDNAIVLAAIDEMIASRSGSVRSFNRAVIGVASS
jgi:hypothetical protein